MLDHGRAWAGHNPHHAFGADRDELVSHQFKNAGLNHFESGAFGRQAPANLGVRKRRLAVGVGFAENAFHCMNRFERRVRLQFGWREFDAHYT